MTDDDRRRQLKLQSIFEPEINDRQRRVAIRYDALRSLLGKAGRFYDQRSPLILPPPVLYLEPEDEWPRHVERDRELRRGQLIFSQRIPRASLVTVWDAMGHEVDTHGFDRVIDDVVDPGPGGTVELRDYEGAFMVGIPVRVTRLNPPPVLYLESEERTWREHRPRTGMLVFEEDIPGAAVVTMRDSAGGEADAFPFQVERGHVVDPGPEGTVEIRDRQGFMILAAVLERVSRERPPPWTTAETPLTGDDEGEGPPPRTTTETPLTGDDEEDDGTPKDPY